MSCLVAVLQLLSGKARRAECLGRKRGERGRDCERGAKPTRGEKVRTHIADRGVADGKFGLGTTGLAAARRHGESAGERQ